MTRTNVYYFSEDDKIIVELKKAAAEATKDWESRAPHVPLDANVAAVRRLGMLHHAIQLLTEPVADGLL